MPVHHIRMLGRHRANYNMQDTVLAQLLYNLNTVHTYVVVSHIGWIPVHHLQMLARRRANDCTGDNISQVIMLPVFDNFHNNRLTASILQ